jgi:hypothetical protein
VDIIKVLAFLTIAIKRAGRYNESAFFIAKSLLSILIGLNLNALVIFLFGRNKTISNVAFILWICVYIAVLIIFSKKQVESYEMNEESYSKARTLSFIWIGLSAILMAIAVNFSIQG